MTDREVILSYLYKVVGEQGCGVSCEEAEVFWEDETWKLRMEGFMEPWAIGGTVDDAKRTIKELAGMGFGLSVASGSRS